jgi:SAM-dependent methyltransferase
MTMPTGPYYRDDLAFIHHHGFAHHAAACAPGILDLLDPVRLRGGLVLEIGCGSGLLTERLVGAGHRVIASDASPAMLALARQVAPGAEEFRQLTLPDDILPPADAVVGVGHALNYLPDEGAIQRSLVSLARALRPGGVLAIDVCDLQWGATHLDDSQGRVDDDWAIISRFSLPTPTQYVRDITTFIRTANGSWRRDDERHVNVLIDTATIPDLLAQEGLRVELGWSFGDGVLPTGLRTVIAHRPG